MKYLLLHFPLRFKNKYQPSMTKIPSKNNFTVASLQLRERLYEIRIITGHFKARQSTCIHLSYKECNFQTLLGLSQHPPLRYHTHTHTHNSCFPPAYSTHNGSLITWCDWPAGDGLAILVHSRFLVTKPHGAPLQQA